MKKIISFRINEEEERRINYIINWYKNNLPFSIEWTKTDIIRIAINEFYNKIIESNK